ncbi:ATP-binding protein [Simiduia litorea]
MGRLLLASLALLPLLIGATGIGLDRAFQQSLVAAEKLRLTSQVYLLLAAVDIDDGQIIMPKVFTEPQFSQPGSGLYGFIHRDDNGKFGSHDERWRSSSAQWLSAEQLLIEPTHKLSSSLIEFSESEQFFILHYRVRWELADQSHLPLVFSVYQDKASFDTGLAAFRAELIYWMATIAIVTLLTQFFLLLWGLLPLRRLTQSVAAFTRGETSRVQGEFPMELRGLTRNVNALLESEKRLRERYRNTLADLAHSVKTPLAVVQNALRDTELDKPLLWEQMQRMQDIVSHQLQRAQIGRSDFLTAIDAVVIARRIVNSLKKLHPQVHFNLPDAELFLRIDEKDLFELLGNTLENACKYGAQRIAVRVASDVHRGEPYNVISLDDDGPGVPGHLRETILSRGQRADEKQAGQGLGLALVQDIMMAYGGELELSTSELGGLQVKFFFPTLKVSVG